MGMCGSSNVKKGDNINKYKEVSDGVNINGKGTHQNESQNHRTGLEADNQENDNMGKRKQNKNKRFKEGMVEDNVIYEKIQKESKHPNNSETGFLSEALSSHFFFFYLNKEEQETVIRKMFYCTVEKGEYVFKQGDSASCFFILFEGEMIVEIDGKNKKTLKPKDGFGELALLYNAPRSASIKSVTRCVLFAIDRKAFKTAVEDVTTKQFQKNREFLDKITFFETMTDTQKDAIAGVLLSQYFKKGQSIISEGDSASSYYLIKEGSAECVQNGNVVRTLQSGDTFGEQALYQAGHRTLTVRAGTDCSCLALSRGDLQEILGARIQLVIQGNGSRWAIGNDPVFKQLTKLQIEKWINNTEGKKVKKDEVILEKGKLLSQVVIVLGGSLRYGDRIFSKNTVFGSDFLYPQTNVTKK